jgi:hypothetical protein
MKILTVLRSGGDFKPEHVARLRKQCLRSVPLVDFYTLTDLPEAGIHNPIRLKHNWPGWWSKMEIFRIPGPVLYIDLDTTIRGSIRELINVAREEHFVALKDFMPGTTGRQMGSGLMAWSGDLRPIYEEFALDPEGHMARCNTPRHWGDQGFIEPLTPGRKYWQELLPGRVVSYKLHCTGGRIPAEARVICHHGKPRPWEI